MAADCGNLAGARAPWLALVPGLAAALVPKCPLCLAAYLSLLGMGEGAASTAAPLLRGAALALATLALGFILLRQARWAHRARRYRPLLLAGLAVSIPAALLVAAPDRPARVIAVVIMVLLLLWADRSRRVGVAQS